VKLMCLARAGGCQIASGASTTAAKVPAIATNASSICCSARAGVAGEPHCEALCYRRGQHSDQRYQYVSACADSATQRVNSAATDVAIV
jgi:hypothetical protein